MRVTMLVRCLAMMRGGGETRHLAWIRELRALGVDVDVITGLPLLFGGARYATPDVPTTLIRSPYLRDAVYRWQRTRGFGRLTTTALHVDEEWFCREAWRRIQSRPIAPDVVHSHAIHQAARLRRCNIPVVVNLPGAPHARYVADLREADALVADGWAASRLPQLLGRSVEHVPKGVDAECFTPEGDSVRTVLGLENKRVVIAVGRLVPIKNMRLAIESLPEVLSRVSTAHLLIVGEGPEREKLDAFARERRVTPHVTFTGYVPTSELPAYYRAADVFALSSTFDNSPNVVLEAMASGLPVVCTDVGGVREFVEAPVGGEMVSQGSAPALADALVPWLQDEPRRGRAAAHNRRAVLERYSWRASAKRLLDVYEHVVSARTMRRQVPA